MPNQVKTQKSFANLENNCSPIQVTDRLEKAVNKLIDEHHQYKEEINILNDKINMFEDELKKAKTLQDNLEKRVFTLIERLKNLVEEEDI